MAKQNRPRVREWQDLTSSEFASIDKKNTVVAVSVSPMEVHGPHLPVRTDIAEAEGLWQSSSELLAAHHPEIEYLHLPPIYVATDVLPQAGSVAFRSSTVVSVLTDLGRSLAKQGFRNIWVSNFHGGPRHYLAIEKAAQTVNSRFGARMVSVFSVMLSRLTDGRIDMRDTLGHIDGLDADALEGDMHAGAIETALMLHLHPELVAADYDNLDQKTVLPRENGEVRDKSPLRALFKTTGQMLAMMKYFERETYAGAPHVATSDMGREILKTLSGLVADALSDLWTGKLSLSDCHSPIWPLRHLFLSELTQASVERLFRHNNQVF